MLDAARTIVPEFHRSSASMRGRRLLTAVSPLLLVLATLGAGHSPAAAQQKVLTVGLEADPTCLDGRQVGFSYALDVSRQVVDSLTDQNPVTGEILPWLAESWTVNDTATEFNFTLKQGITFSDGSPVNAAAVVANFNDLKKQPYGTSFIRDLKTFEAVGERNVKFTFSVPNAQFLQATSTVQLGLIAPATLASATQVERCAGKLVGSGPFIYKDVVAQQRVTLDARKDYAWPTPVSSNKGRAQIDQLVIEIIPEAGVRNGSLLSGTIDVDHLVQEQDEKALSGAGALLISAPSRGLANSLLPNEQSPVWKDAELRRAISLAVNRSDVAQILSSNSRAATSILTRATPGYSDFSKLLQTDVEKAKSALDALGWVPGAKGVRAKDGKPLTLRVVLRKNPTRQAVLEVVQQQLAAVGARLVIDIQDSATATDSEKNGNYDFVFWSASRNDVDVLRNFYDPAGLNPTRRADDGSEFNALLNKLRETTEKAETQKAVDRFVEIVLKDGHAIPLFESSANLGASAKVQGLILDAANRPLFQQVTLKAK